MKNSTFQANSLDSSPEILNQILMHGSNHPRRASEIKSASVSFHASYQYIKTQLLQKGNRSLLNYIFFLLWICVLINLRIWALLSRRSWHSMSIATTKSRLILFAGDSHSEFASRVNVKSLKTKLFTLWLGPLLCNSFAKKPEINKSILVVARNLLACQGSPVDELVFVYSMGEIDIRSHSWVQIRLRNNYKNIDHYAADLAASYVKRIEDGISEASCLRVSRVCAIVIQPAPPSDHKAWIEPKVMAAYKEYLRNNEYPRIGSPCFRRKVHASFCSFLRDNIAATAIGDKIIYCQLPLEVFDVRGGLARKSSKDGCHIDNPRTISLTVEEICRILEAVD
jgi:hypothetical protein